MWMGSRMTDVVRVCRSTNQTSLCQIYWFNYYIEDITHNNREETGYKALRPSLEAREAETREM